MAVIYMDKHELWSIIGSCIFLVWLFVSFFGVGVGVFVLVYLIFDNFWMALSLGIIAGILNLFSGLYHWIFDLLFEGW
jgi:hypothetical protein